MLVRENLEGLYVGFEHYIPSEAIRTRSRSPRASTPARTARASSASHSNMRCSNGRKKVTVVHKANVLKALTGIFLEAGREIAQGIRGPGRDGRAHRRRLRDAAGDESVAVRRDRHDKPFRRHPVGRDRGAGRRPRHGARGPISATKAAIFEAVHGSAPDIAGKGIANPLALLLAAALMLDHVERKDLADQLRAAVLRALQSGAGTRDLGGTASTEEFASAIIGQLTAQAA